MAKPRKLQSEVYEYLLKELKEIWRINRSSQIIKKKTPRFPSKASLANYVLSSPFFIDSNNHVRDTDDTKGKTSLSRNTVTLAVNRLIDDKKIVLGPNGYEYDPHFEEDLDRFPIRNIASQIDITIGVPENMLFLSVSNGMAASVAEYLSALFHKGDILFIPLGEIIMCVGVLPLRKIEAGDALIGDSWEWMLSRIEVALSGFNMRYPNFSYKMAYEREVGLYHDPNMMEDIEQQAAENIENNPTSIILGKTKDEEKRDIINAHESLFELEKRIEEIEIAAVEKTRKAMRNLSNNDKTPQKPEGDVFQSEDIDASDDDLDDNDETNFDVGLTMKERIDIFFSDDIED